jgi:hypothetical protein
MGMCMRMRGLNLRRTEDAKEISRKGNRIATLLPDPWTSSVLWCEASEYLYCIYALE